MLLVQVSYQTPLVSYIGPMLFQPHIRIILRTRNQGVVIPTGVLSKPVMFVGWKSALVVWWFSIQL